MSQPSQQSSGKTIKKPDAPKTGPEAKAAQDIAPAPKTDKQLLAYKYYCLVHPCPSGITAEFVYYANPAHSHWRGFTLTLPRGASNVEDGFGTFRSFDPQQRKASVSQELSLHVRLPMHKTKAQAWEWPPEDREEYRPGPWLRIHLQVDEDAEVEVDDWGMPYENKGHPCGDWINGAASVGGIRLIDFFKGRDFFFSVRGPKTPHIYLEKFNLSTKLAKGQELPYGDDHAWNPRLYRGPMSEDIRGDQFELCMRFDDTNALLATISQSVVQDQFWVAEEAMKIFKTKLPAYFLPKGKEEPECSSFFMIVKLNKSFRITFADAWTRLQKSDGTNRVWTSFFEDQSDLDWVCLGVDHKKWGEEASALDTGAELRVIERPDRFPVLKNHGLDEFDLVLNYGMPLESLDPLMVRRVFSSRQQALDALAADRSSWNTVTLALDPQLADTQSLVESVWDMGNCSKRTCARPSFRLDPDAAYLSQSRVLELWSGRGFWRTQLEASNSRKRKRDSVPPISKEQEWTLPTTNLLPKDSLYWEALKTDVDRDDVRQFERHMARAPLGVVLISASAGYGKTTRAAVAALCLVDRFKKVYASGPTHIAVNHFLEQTDRLDAKAVEYYRNSDGDDQGRVRRLIVRARRLDDEVTATRRLLEKPGLTESELFPWQVGRNDRWQLQNSVAYWLLKIFGSPAVAALDDRDPEAVVALHKDIFSIHGGQRLIDAVKAGDWDTVDKAASPDVLDGLTRQLLEDADMIFSTPAMSRHGPCLEWKKHHAAAFAVDEAANMKRADMMRLWGNCLLPIMMSGDDEQLEPAVMTEYNKDGKGRYLNRHFQDGKMSAMQWLKAHNWPVYVLVKQFRMARGMMDAIGDIIYPEVKLVYAPSCDITNAVHRPGVLLDEFLREKFPSIAPAPTDRLYPAFMHCPETFTYLNPVTHGKSNYQQCERALNFWCEFSEWVEAKGDVLDHRQIVTICPYKANLEVIQSLRRKYKYARLDKMPPAATVDSFQCKEGGLVCLILGTTRAVGAGFTSNRNRLNVACTRHRSGLVVFGDIHVMGAVDGVEDQPDAGRPKGKGKKANNKVVTADGKKVLQYTAAGVKASNLKGPLKDLLKWFGEKKRVGVIRGEEKTG
ncbi:helicase MAGATAMA-like protein [Emericellopsis cladophorae]|uniref:Helicase MAGATAMA-like protein n=1 Tax=Emericellopsis cladophorae TaxID=2686198 RepID=A0A9P9XWR2_9HYPO|nr:helicase MAGATAMA-like protein [Emericellopsis cladophorae]KAI6778968.1 helicase MAGATAMA-like protein [Emericellopsis cladophorae]